MQQILDMLSSPLVLIVLLMAAGTTLVLFTVAAKFEDTPDPMKKFSEQSRTVLGDEVKSLNRAKKKESAIEKKLEKYEAFLAPTDSKQAEAARKEMIQAGYYGRNAVRDFHAIKFIMAIGGLLVGLLMFYVVLPPAEDAGMITRVATIGVPLLVAWYAPMWWVNKRRAERQSQISRGFPDALDMLLICTEAGQSMDQSINRVAKELQVGYPALAEEFATVANEVKAGKDRLDVLRDMGERCGNNDIKSFVTVLIQSATYGTSVADSLRVYASEMRDKRVMLAEEKANVLPTKLTLGTMMFTVPPLLIILIGPSVYGVSTMLSTMSFNGP